MSQREKKAFFVLGLHKLIFFFFVPHLPLTCLPLVEGVEVLVINALRKEKHISHFNLDEALEVIEKVGPKQAYLTHISHLLGRHREVSLDLPRGVALGEDGLKISVP